MIGSALKKINAEVDEPQEQKTGKKINPQKQEVNEAMEKYEKSTYTFASVENCIHPFLGKHFVEHLQETVLILNNVLNDANQACTLSWLVKLHEAAEDEDPNALKQNLKEQYLQELLNAAKRHRNGRVDRVLWTVILRHISDFYEANVRTLIKTRFRGALKQYIAHKLNIWGLSPACSMSLAPSVTCAILCNTHNEQDRVVLGEEDYEESDNDDTDGFDSESLNGTAFVKKRIESLFVVHPK